MTAPIRGPEQIEDWVSRLAGAAIAFIVACGALLGMATPTAAYTLNPQGCHMPNSSIYYYFSSVTSPYRNAHINGETAWDGTSAWGTFLLTSQSANANIMVYDYYYGPDFPVAVVGGGCEQDGVWYNSRVTLKYNQTAMDGYSATLKKVVAIHELGHTYGLADATQAFSCVNAVGKAAMMRDCGGMWETCGYQTPLIDDVAGVNDIYG